MLSKIRGPHAKKILWILAIIIIIAFGLSGAGFYLSGRGKSAIGTIGNKKITPAIYSQYIRLAKVYLLTHIPPDEQKITWRDIEKLAQEFMVLLWKADKENIEVSDQEVVGYIKESFFGQEKFNEGFYTRYLEFISKRYNLALTNRSYEECVRDFIKINKLFEKYIIIQVSDEEVKELYKKDNQEAKIAYLSIPYEKFKVETALTAGEIEEFYQENESLFRREPKVSLKYIVVTPEIKLQEKIKYELADIKTIEELAEKFSLEIKETGFIGATDPIKEIGWQPQINKIAFALEKNKMIPVGLGYNLIIMVKQDQREAFTPALDEITEEVKEKLIMSKAKQETKRFSQDLLKEIKEKKITDLKKLSNKRNVEFKETGYFKYYDYIEGIGLDEKISEIIFSLKTNQIYPQSLMLQNSSVIIQLKSLTPFDEEDFSQKKEYYYNILNESKELIERAKFLQQIKKEADLKIFLLPQNR